MIENDYKTIYRNAWNEYYSQIDTLSEEEKIKLEQTMDTAQNNFTHEEWGKFADTLVGFRDYWDNYVNKAKEFINKKFGKDEHEKDKEENNGKRTY